MRGGAPGERALKRGKARAVAEALVDEREAVGPRARCRLCQRSAAVNHWAAVGNWFKWKAYQPELLGACRIRPSPTACAMRASVSGAITWPALAARRLAAAAR